MNNAKHFKLGDLVTFKRGYDLAERERVSGKYSIISSSGATGTHNQFKVAGPGVVTGRYGTIGKVFYVSDDFWPLNTSLYVQDFKGNDRRFIAYYLQTILSASFNSAGAVPGVNRNILHKISIAVPPQAQTKIAAILSAYDELIENNRRRMALLEKLAEELYREWFVRLRFPGHEKVKLVKGIPQGWERTKVMKLTSYLKRGVAPEYDDSATSLAINQKCIRDGKVDLSFARRQSREVSAERQVRFGDVLVNSTGEGTLGRVGQVLAPITGCIVDSHVTIVRPKPEVPIHYLGMTLKAWEAHFSIMGRGATNQTELAPAVIGNVEVTMPTEPLQKEFESHAAPIFSQVTQLTALTERLTKTRDLLLPRLISGKLSVADLDIQFPPGMAGELNVAPTTSRHA